MDAALADRVLRRRSAEVSTESLRRGAVADAAMAGIDETAALRAYGALGTLVETWSKAPRQVLARLHVLTARGLVDDASLGRPVAGADRLAVLSDVLAATSAPAVVVGSVVLGELLALDAFAPVSPVVGWAALRLTFVERGLDPKSLVMAEVDAGPAPLDSYRAGEMATWIGYVADAVVSGARETRAVCEAMRRG